MSIFRKPSVSQDDIDSAKREGGRLLNEVTDRVNNGTASDKDKRVFNATRTRAGRIK
ncbi:hypothetical protein [Streptomyces sp. BH104]|uniref:hypothetical protein n=1 Tax=Streptomyces sp. BH104 TaxID=3410407 RepID=UPI003BB48E81